MKKSNKFTNIAMLLTILILCFGTNSAQSHKQEEKMATEQNVKQEIVTDSHAFTGLDGEEDELRKYEIGVHFTYLQFGTFDSRFTREYREIVNFPPGIPFVPARSNPKEPGAGARFTYNFTRSIAVEAEVNWYMRRKDMVPHPPPDTSPWQGGQKLQIIAGPKIGYRFGKFGVFGKVRPGIIHFVEFPVTTWIQTVPPGQPFLRLSSPRRATFFNVDVGGVFEYYPSKRTVIRFDMGDTIIHYNAQDPKEFNPTFNRHNLQMNLGVGFRF